MEWHSAVVARLSSRPAVSDAAQARIPPAALKPPLVPKNETMPDEIPFYEAARPNRDLPS